MVKILYCFLRGASVQEEYMAKVLRSNFFLYVDVAGSPKELKDKIVKEKYDLILFGCDQPILRTWEGFKIINQIRTGAEKVATLQNVPLLIFARIMEVPVAEIYEVKTPGDFRYITREANNARGIAEIIRWAIKEAHKQ